MAVSEPRQVVSKSPRGMTFQIQVFLIPEGDQVVAYAPALELSTYGSSRQDAREAFREVLDIFVRDTQAKGTLEKVLLELGWKLQQKPVVNYEPPAPPAAFLNEVGKKTFQTVVQPMTLAL